MSHGIITNTKELFSGLDKRLIICALGLIFFVVAEALFSPLKAALLVGFFLLLACSWYRPMYVVLAIAVLLPLEPFLLKWVVDDIYVFARYASEVAIYVVFAVAAVKAWERIHVCAKMTLIIPFIFFAAVAILSTFVNHNAFMIDVMGLRQLFRFILLYFAIGFIAPSRQWIFRLAVVLLGVVFVESSIGILQALSHGGLDSFLIPAEQKYFEAIQLTQGTNVFWQEGQRIFATLGRYDQLGTFLCFFLLLIIGVIYECVNKKWRILLLGIAFAGCIALLLTYSRASWFGLICGIAMIAIALKKDKKVLVGYIAALLIGIGVYVTLGTLQQYRIDVSNQTLTERLFEAFSPERLKGEYYALGRTYFFLHTPPAVLTRAPLLGVGPGAFGGGAATALHATEGYTALNLPFGINGTEGYIDNNWFSILGETGYAGLIFYAAMLFVLFRSAYRVFRINTDPLMRGLSLGYCGALVAFAFQGFFATYFEVRTIAPYIWLFGGIIAVEEQDEQIRI